MTTIETHAIEALADQLMAAHIEEATGEPRPHKPDPLGEDVRKSLALDLAERLVADPVLVRFEQAQRTTRELGIHFYCTEPWHALAEKRGAAAAMALAAAGGPALSRVDRVWPEASLVLARLALDASAYLWRDETFHLALDAPLPEHVIADDVMPLPLMFFSYERSLGLTKPDGTESENKVNWMMLARGRVGLLVVHDSFPPGKAEELLGDDVKLEIETFVVPYRIHWPLPQASDSANNVIAGVLRQLAFLKAPFVQSKRERLPRELRREVARKAKGNGAASEEPTVSVVVLRRSTQAHPDREPHGGGGHKRRHWVKGHYRAQWYPSKQAHEVIYIEPHIRGAGGMVEHVYDVRH